MGTQSHRSNGLHGPYDGGTAGIQSTAWTASVPHGDELLVVGARAYMTSSSKIDVTAGYSWTAFPLYTCARRATPCPSAPDFPRSMMCGDPFIAPAVIGSQNQHGCATEHTR